MFYQGKHFKRDPRRERVMNIPSWIWGEIIFYIKWWISLPNKAAILIDYHDSFWDRVDDITLNFIRKVKEDIEDLKN